MTEQERKHLETFEEWKNRLRIIDMMNVGNDDLASRTKSPLQILEIERNDIHFSIDTVKNLNYVLRYGNLHSLNISYNNLGD